ncbi:MAG: NADH(P)-binding [Mucilaginibacter sp.]|nr:NADH(P)-binding [Mucilaginibacter sp.]
MAKKAIIAGASGLTGSCLLDILLHQPAYDEVLVLVRKDLPVKHSKLTQMVVDFDKLDDFSVRITGDVLFCCLGSTKKKTPDLKDYRKVDHDYPFHLAQIALKNGISQFHSVSAIGASIKASNFYTKMKGEAENDIINVGLHSLHIYQPSFIAGERKENRPLEKFFIGLMKVIDPILIGKLKKYRSIAAKTIASAMYKQSLKNKTRVHIYSSDKIKELS